MRIGINALYMIPGKHGGGEQYLRNLLTSLADVDARNEYFLFANKSNFGTFGITQNNFTEILCNFPSKSKQLRIFWEQAILPFQAKKYGLSVLHSPANVSPIIKVSKCKYVVTIHDIMYCHHPGFYSSKRLFYLRSLLPASAHNADRIITVSKTNKADIIKCLSVPEHKISVIPTSGFPDGLKYEFDDEKIKAMKIRYGLNDNFILCVASFNLQKNIKGLLEAFSLIKKKYGLKHQLVLVGMLLAPASGIIKLIETLKLEEDVKITGYVSGEDLPYLYSLADLYVLPSIFEGLGVTPWEAMSCGCPVATSDIPTLREVVGNAAVTFDPYNVQEMADTIFRVLTDAALRKELIKKGAERIKQFSWKKAALETLKVFERTRFN